MELTLLTYDSTVCHNAGYLDVSNVSSLIKNLNKLVAQFCKITNIPKNQVFWVEVTNSDWCKNMVFIYGVVDKNWKPTSKTYVVNKSYDKDWNPNLAQSFSTYIKGYGENINILKQPPQNPHNLFKTIVK